MCLLSVSGFSEPALGLLGRPWPAAGRGEEGVRVHAGSAEGSDAGVFGSQRLRENHRLSIILPGAAQTSGNSRRKPDL